MDFQAGSMVLALMMMAIAVIVRIGTAQLLKGMRQAISQVDVERQRWLNDLKTAQSQKKVAEANKASLMQKKLKLGKKRRTLLRVLKKYNAERTRKEEMRAAVRGDV